MDRTSRLYRFLKKCETPPRENALWLALNLLFNAFLVLVGRLLLAAPSMGGKRQYILVATLNMGDCLLLYRSLDELIGENGYDHPVILLDRMLYRQFTVLHVENLRIAQFWKIMAMDKAVQYAPERYPNVTISTPWLFFDNRRASPKAAFRTLPKHLRRETVSGLYPEENMKGNTVILSPYQQSFSTYGEQELPAEFWPVLAASLKQAGFHVMTNCNGKTELPVAGTGVFFPPLEELAGAAEYGGYCVSVRSGFTDWLSSAELKREIVLYPSRKYLDIFSIHQMWNKTGIWEYVYSPGEDICRLAEKITAYLTAGGVAE